MSSMQGLRRQISGTLRRSRNIPPVGNLEFAFDWLGFFVLTGWSTKLEIALDGPLVTTCVRIPRPDVTPSLSQLNETGFVLVIRASSQLTDSAFGLSELCFLLRKQGIDGSPLGLSDLDRMGPSTVSALEASIRELGADVVGYSESPGTPLALRAMLTASARKSPSVYVDRALMFAEKRVMLATGWCHRESQFAIVDTEDNAALEVLSYWTFERPDVVSTHGSGHCGFLYYVRVNDPSHAVAVKETPATSTPLTGLVPEIVQAPDMRQFTEAAFSVGTHPSQFIERLNSGEGALIAKMVEEEKAMRRKDPSRVHTRSQVPDPTLSVVIPLYRRYDMLWNQFACWSSAHGLAVELVLVNDDPASSVQFTELSAKMSNLFGCSVTVVSTAENLGFSGACNTGANHARGRYVLFLNSDAILVDPDSVVEATGVLDQDSSIGLLGGVLLRPDGLVDHAGMGCVYLSERGTWFNHHPHAGWFVADLPHESYWDADAVTGALMLVRRDEFLDLGGFSERYLVGDYEDSDLCWRYELSGARVAVASKLRAGHVPRTSMGLIGDSHYQERLSLLNSWIHAQRWRRLLEVKYPTSHGQFL